MVQKTVDRMATDHSLDFYFVHFLNQTIRSFLISVSLAATVSVSCYTRSDLSAQALAEGLLWFRAY